MKDQYTRTAMLLGEDSIEKLQHAHVAGPWYLALLPAAGAGALSRCRKHGKLLTWILGTVLFLPLVLAAACMTQVNGIAVGALLGRLIPMLPALL